MSRRRRSTLDSDVSFGVYTVHPPASPPFVAIAAAGPGEPMTWGISLGDAYELGRTLVDQVEALLSGVSRPWDDDPGRPPFASRSFGRGGVRGSASGAAASSRAGSRTPGSRPTRAVDSGA